MPDKELLSTQVTLTGSLASFSPSLPPSASSSSTTFSYTYIDSASISDQKPWQRFTLPIGQAFNLGNQQNQQWYLTLANMASQQSSDVQSYAIRATCMAADQVGSVRAITSMLVLSTALIRL